jgi:hypothetical protein
MNPQYSQSLLLTIELDFQLMASPKAFKRERASWRAVIQLNVVRSVRLILEAMHESVTSANESPPPTGASNSYFPRSPYGTHPGNRLSYPETSSSLESHHNLANQFLTIRAPSPSPQGTQPAEFSPTSGTTTPGGSHLRSGLTNEHLKLKMRLTPLLQIEDILLRRLASSEGRECELGSAPATPSGSGPHSKSSSRPGSSSRRRPGTGGSTRSGKLTILNMNLPPVDPRMKTKEAAVNSSVGWKDALARLLPVDPSASMDQLPQDWDMGRDDPGTLLNACAADMKMIWADPVIRQLLDDNKVRLEDMSGL